MTMLMGNEWTEFAGISAGACVVFVALQMASLCHWEALGMQLGSTGVPFGRSSRWESSSVTMLMGVVEFVVLPEILEAM